MVRLAVLGATALLASSVAAQLKKDCGPGYGKCPESKPCCSQYGQCGIGAYCLGGCDPLNSFKLQSCVAAPQCQSKTYKFTDSKSSPILSNTKFLGDPSKADWVSDGQPLYANGVVYLTMAPETVGTVLASTRYVWYGKISATMKTSRGRGVVTAFIITRYVWYGKISATMKTSRGRGVVTAFIMMSDVKDEIDYEWVGVDLQTSQTNYYWNGIPDYTHSGNITMAGDTYAEWHTYTIDWTPDSITWSVDGQVGRTKKKSDTYNATTGHFEFPQTPSRVQLSLWPGGLPSNGKGTIDWAGGVIDWNSDEIKKHEYYYAMVKEVTVECYDPPSGATGSGKVSYAWKDAKAVNTSVELSNEGTILKSFLASGTDKDVELPDAVSSATTVVSTDSNGKATTIVTTLEPTGTSVGTVPGLDGAGFDSGDLNNGDENGGNGGSDGTDSSDPETTEWVQSNNNGGSSAAPRITAFSDNYMMWGNFLAILAVAGAMATL